MCGVVWQKTPSSKRRGDDAAATLVEAIAMKLERFPVIRDDVLGFALPLLISLLDKAAHRPIHAAGQPTSSGSGCMLLLLNVRPNLEHQSLTHKT